MEFEDLDDASAPLFWNATQVIRYQLHGEARPFKNQSVERPFIQSRYVEAYMDFYPYISWEKDTAQFRKPAVVGACVYALGMMEEYERLDFYEFWLSLVKGDELKVGTPLHTVYKEILSAKHNTMKRRLTIMRKLLHGISAHMHNRPLKELSGKMYSEYDDMGFIKEYMEMLADLDMAD